MEKAVERASSSTASLATGSAHKAASSHEEVLGVQLEAAVAAGDLEGTRRLLREKSERIDPDLLFVACQVTHSGPTLSTVAQPRAV